jgi:branched-chain amino acid transport system permease protein
LSAAEFVNLLISAILLAGIYAVMSLGMTIIYGVMKIINLAHPGIMMLGAYFAYEWFERTGLNPIIAALLSVPVFFIIGMGIHWTLVRRLPPSDQPTLPSLLLLFGLWLVLQNIGYLVWGNTDRAINTDLTLSIIRLGPLLIPGVRAVVFLLALASLIALEITLNRTWFGRAIRALTQNRYAGQLVGINTSRTARVAFGLGIAFAGFAGALLANLYSFNPDFGRSFLIRSFVIIVLGGLESFSGVALGALLVALVETFSILVVPAAYQPAISFALLVVALVAIPGGLGRLFSRRQRLA